MAPNNGLGLLTVVMGPTHAMSGAVAWLAGVGSVATFTGYHQSPAEIAVYTAVTAGAALLPDLDCSGRVLTNQGGSTVARAFGVVSLFIAECVEKSSLGIYRLTSTKKDGKRKNGHRTFTHTWIFAALLCFGVTELVQRFGRSAVIPILFLTLGLALRGLLADWAKKSGWVLITLTSASATIAAWQNLPTDNGYPLLGLAVGIGCVVHTMGDMITHAGCPVLWPLPIGRKLWHEFGLPKALALRAGGAVEFGLLLPLLTLSTLVMCIWQVPTAREAIASLYTAATS